MKLYSQEISVSGKLLSENCGVRKKHCQERNGRNCPVRKKMSGIVLDPQCPDEDIKTLLVRMEERAVEAAMRSTETREAMAG